MLLSLRLIRSRRKSLSLSPGRIKKYISPYRSPCVLGKGFPLPVCGFSIDNFLDILLPIHSVLCYAVPPRFPSEPCRCYSNQYCAFASHFDPVPCYAPARRSVPCPCIVKRFLSMRCLRRSCPRLALAAPRHSTPCFAFANPCLVLPLQNSSMQCPCYSLHLQTLPCPCYLCVPLHPHAVAVLSISATAVPGFSVQCHNITFPCFPVPIALPFKSVSLVLCALHCPCYPLLRATFAVQTSAELSLCSFMQYCAVALLVRATALHSLALPLLI